MVKPSEVIAVQVVGLIAAGVGRVVGYLFATDEAFFGERNTPAARVVGFVGLAAASLALFAGPF